MANERTFNFIFDCVIGGIGDALGDQVLGAKMVEALRQHKVPICKVYNSLRTSIKTAYMYDSARPLDRHKCAAAFMVAFLNALPIKESLLNKEELAISIGMLILKIFIFEECNKCLDFGFIDFIEKQEGLVFPTCECDMEPYEYNWALGIHYDRNIEKVKNARALSPLALSNTLFMIEKYNRLCAGL